MNVELDEVYLASIKEMFKEFDDEIIWTAIFEHGYDENGNYKLETVVDYLLELSGKNIENTKFKIPESNVVYSSNLSDKNKLDLPADRSDTYHSNNENDNLLNLNDDDDDAKEIEPDMFQDLINLFKNDNKRYEKIDDNL